VNVLDEVTVSTTW